MVCAPFNGRAFTRAAGAWLDLPSIGKCDFIIFEDFQQHNLILHHADDTAQNAAEHAFFADEVKGEISEAHRSDVLEVGEHLGFIDDIDHVFRVDKVYLDRLAERQVFRPAVLFKELDRKSVV